MKTALMAAKSRKLIHELPSRRGRREGGMLEDVLPCKPTLTVNAIAVKAVKTSQSKSAQNPGACTYRYITICQSESKPKCQIIIVLKVRLNYNIGQLWDGAFVSFKLQQRQFCISSS